MKMKWKVLILVFPTDYYSSIFLGEKYDKRTNREFSYKKEFYNNRYGVFRYSYKFFTNNKSKT